MEYKMREDGTAGVPSSFTLRQALLTREEEGGIAPALSVFILQRCSPNYLHNLWLHFYNR